MEKDLYLKINNIISLKDEVEKLIEQDEFKDQMLACVTHDLRTPINGIQFFIKQVLEICEDNEEVKKYLNWALVNSELLFSLINDILDYSQIKKNQIKLNIEDFLMKDLITEIETLMEMKAKHKEIQLQIVNKLSNTVNKIKNDKRRIKQILINLITNAIKFTENGFVRIKFSSKSDKIIKASVKDSGIGIKQEIIKTLGNPYVTYNEKERNKDGIGLGLFICKTIAGFIGPENKLEIKSTYGHGATFSFLFYVRNKDDEESGCFSDSSIEEFEFEGSPIIDVRRMIINKNSFLLSEQINDIQVITVKKNLNIAIIDDDFFSLTALKQNLLKLKMNNSKFKNMNVFAENKGKNCVKLFEEKNYEKSEDNIHIIILDLIMPIMNGYETAELVLEKINKNGYIKPVIIAYSSLNYENIKGKKVFDLILNKPASYESLKKILLNVIKK